MKPDAVHWPDPSWQLRSILSASYPIDGLADSKTLSALRRETLADEIRLHAAAWALGMASVEEIDQLNILQATLLAMQRAVHGTWR